jgi:hypothetical protein
MIKNNYDLVLEVIKNYESERILNDFKIIFIEGENISKEDFWNFNYKYIDDISEEYYIKLNWKYIESGGDESIFDGVMF